MNMVKLTCILAGLILLMAGRKALWLFLGLAVFAIAVAFIQSYLPNLDDRTLLVVSLVAGVIAAVASVALAKALVWVGGVACGGYIGVVAWQTLGPAAGGFPWLACAIGGVVGILVAKFLFESLLVLGSSAVGAALLVHTLGVDGTPGLALLILLAALGVVVQGKFMPGKSARPSASKETEEEKPRSPVS